MIVQIKIRGDDGKFRDVTRAEFADAAFEKTSRESYGDPWVFLRDRLASWCLRKAREYSTNAAVADAWIARYQAIRGTK